MRISDWSSDVCSSDLVGVEHLATRSQGGRTVIHRFHERAVGIVPALKGKDLIRHRAPHDERVNLALTDRTEGFLGFIRVVGSFRLPGLSRIINLRTRFP